MKYVCVPKEGHAPHLTRDLTWDEYYQVRRTGMLDGQRICAIEEPVQTEGTEKQPKRILVYDFISDSARYLHVEASNALRQIR